MSSPCSICDIDTTKNLLSIKYELKGCCFKRTLTGLIMGQVAKKYTSDWISPSDQDNCLAVHHLVSKNKNVILHPARFPLHSLVE